ncbi:MAG: molybdopterin-dependent oxidoreductase [Spirochaetaceae bacterium]|jgi:CO/xanthine dehydrogenase Mo-binding subunit|nr:molybdopterin-dependent oxidoreductase [Spirochaetaceae bacterium]
MFVDDIPVKDGFYAVIIRSPAAKGTLRQVRCPGLAPGSGVTLITAADIPGNPDILEAGLPLLAGESVSYIGEPVAVLAGPRALQLEELAARCVVEVEQEKPEFLIEDAWDAESWFARQTREAGPQSRLKGELVVEGHYITGLQEHWYSEPHGAIAVPEGNGGYTIKTSTQRPGELGAAVARALGVEAGKIKVENGELGIHFDGKLWYPSVIASLAALAAFVTKKTVKLQLTREEDYLYSPKRNISVLHVRSLLTFEGQILETDVLAKIGFGAAGVLAGAILDEVCDSLIGVYKLGRITIEALAIKTNNPPSGPFAGFGAALSSFAIERHLSKISDILGEGGAQGRGKRLKSKLKTRFDNAACDILEAVSKESGFQRKWAAYELQRDKRGGEPERVLPQRGIGFAFALAGGGRETAPAAACVIEVEIDRVNYESKIRGIWLYVLCGRPSSPSHAELVLRRSVNAALGWTSTEKIRFVDGMIQPSVCALYQILPASETPPLHISFAYEAGAPECPEERLEELPFGTVSAAYTQAITQAINHHFERVPITGQDVWRVITMKKQEDAERQSGEKPAASPEHHS